MVEVRAQVSKTSSRDLGFIIYKGSRLAREKKKKKKINTLPGSPLTLIIISRVYIQSSKTI